jgi:hypothetical protein
MGSPDCFDLATSPSLSHTPSIPDELSVHSIMRSFLLEEQKLVKKIMEKK